jgi:hypothetical protein
LTMHSTSAGVNVDACPLKTRRTSHSGENRGAAAGYSGYRLAPVRFLNGKV